MSTIRDLMSVREIKAGVPTKTKNSEKKAEKTSKEGGKQIVRAGGPGSGRHPEHGSFKKTGHDMTPLKSGQHQGYYNGMKTTYESAKGTQVEMHDHAFRGTAGTVRFKENGKTVKEVPRHEAGKFAHQRYGIRYKAVKP